VILPFAAAAAGGEGDAALVWTKNGSWPYKFYVENYCDHDAYVIYKKVDTLSEIPTSHQWVPRMDRQEMDCFDGRAVKVQLASTPGDNETTFCTARSNPFYCRSAPDVPVIRVECDRDAADGPRRCAANEIHEQCASFSPDVAALCPARSAPVLAMTNATTEQQSAAVAAAFGDAPPKENGACATAMAGGRALVVDPAGGAVLDAQTLCPVCACRAGAECASHADAAAHACNTDVDATVEGTCFAAIDGVDGFSTTFASRSSRTACVPNDWIDLTAPPAFNLLDDDDDDDGGKSGPPKTPAPTPRPTTPAPTETHAPTAYGDRDQKKKAAAARRASNMAAFVIAFLAVGVAACAIRQAVVKQRRLRAPRAGLYVDIPSDAAELTSSGAGSAPRRVSSGGRGVFGGIEMMMSGGPGGPPDGL